MTKSAMPGPSQRQSQRPCRGTVRTLGTALGLAALLIACAPPDTTPRTALLFAVSTYVEGRPSDEWPNLVAPSYDLDSMDTALKTKGWVTVPAVASSSSASINKDAVSKEAIRKAIEGRRDSSGLVLFYFSGHGDLIDNESYILPHIDNLATLLMLGKKEEIKAMSISASELRGMFQNAGLKNVIIILDTCNSGGFVQPGASADAIPQTWGAGTPPRYDRYTAFVDAVTDSIQAYIGYQADSRFVTLSAAGRDELSWEIRSPNPHGFFTLSLLYALSDARADYDRDGFVTTSELYRFCSAFIQINWNAVRTQDRFFHPHLSGNPRDYALWAARP